MSIFSLARNLNEFPMCPSVVYPFSSLPPPVHAHIHEISTILVKQTANKQTKCKRRAKIRTFKFDHCCRLSALSHLFLSLSFSAALLVTFYSFVIHSRMSECGWWTMGHCWCEFVEVKNRNKQLDCQSQIIPSEFVSFDCSSADFIVTESANLFKKSVKIPTICDLI